MRLLASTDFALRVLMRLAAEPEALRSTEVLAREVGVPRNHIHKILQELAGLGLARTVRGVRGGVALAKPAAEITLGNVVRALEREQVLVECFRADGGACCFNPGCRLQTVLGGAREAFLRHLDRVTLASMAGMPRAAA